MENNKVQNKKGREFGLTTLALKNKITVYLLTGILLLFSLFFYLKLPKELFPDIIIPTVMVQTVYPGNPPIDMENLVTRPIEKQIESVKGVNEISSTSTQDLSYVFVVDKLLCVYLFLSFHLWFLVLIEKKLHIDCVFFEFELHKYHNL